jgi:hypothetical protein
MKKIQGGYMSYKPILKPCSDIRIDDPHVLAVARHIVDSIKLSMLKAIAHADKPQSYAISSDKKSMENMAFKYFESLEPKQQKHAVEKAKKMLSAPKKIRQKMFGKLAQIDLASASSIEDQLRALSLDRPPSLPKGHAKTLALVGGRIVSKPPLKAKTKMFKPKVSVAKKPLKVKTEMFKPKPKVLVGKKPPISIDPISFKYVRLKGKKGFLGKKVGGRGACPDGVGQYQHYQGGSIYWHPSTGAHFVRDKIKEKWKSLGWEKGILGYPKTDERETPDKEGRYNHFQYGSIYWHPETGAHEIHGDIWKKWRSLGWETGYLGYPTTDECTTPDTVGRYHTFQGGSIYWTPGTGAQAVHPLILKEWGRHKYELGFLGYPIESTRKSGSKNLANKFQGGEIRWKAASKTADTSTAPNTLRCILTKIKCISPFNFFSGDDIVASSWIVEVGHEINWHRLGIPLGRFRRGHERVFSEVCGQVDLSAWNWWPKDIVSIFFLVPGKATYRRNFIDIALTYIESEYARIVFPLIANWDGAAQAGVGYVLGPVIAASIGRIVEGALRWMEQFLGDEFPGVYFPPIYAHITIPSVHHRWNGSYDSPESSVPVQKLFGRYKLWCRWSLVAL